ncbi:DEAD/DEAH box helicase family protein [bacterium]|nr:DEAD/DEAH box helicase family protein [bacterium]
MTPFAQGLSYDLVGVKMEGKYAYQLEATKAAVAAKNGILRMATGAGKCLAPDTRVLLYSGDVIAAKDVRVGHQLMGPDSRPRTVLSTCTGQGPMYEIVPNKGDAWQCNDVHVLTLRKTGTEEVVDIPLDQYLKSNNNFKHLYKQYSVGVDFPDGKQPSELPIDPYFLGVWYGDGRKDLSQGVQVTTMDPEIVETLKFVASSWSLSVRKYNSAASGQADTYALVRTKGASNKLLDALRTVTDCVSLPSVYLRAAREARLQFLAGLLDTDGSIDKNSRSFEFTQLRKSWVEDVATLARSLGFYATSPRAKVVGTTTYWRTSIYGALSTIPVRIKRKRERALDAKGHYSTNTGFQVREVGVGEYCGFTLDGDGRFLLSDFVVTHNTEVSCAITKYLGLKTLFIVTTRELLYQAQDRFMRRLGVDANQIGLVGDGHWSPGSWVTVATVDTLESRLAKTECQELLKETDVLFVDEAHHAGSETWYEVCILCNASYRFGLSGTPLDRTDGANLRLLAAIGPIIVDIPNKFLVEQGITARAQIIFSKITQPVLAKKLAYASAYKQGVVDNPHALELVVSWTRIFQQEGLSTLILVEELAHGRKIDEALWTTTEGDFIPHLFIHGEEDTAVRANALKDFGERRLPVLVASSLPYEELVLVRGATQGIKLTPIGNFVENLYSTDFWECWTRQDDGQDAWAHVTGVVAHPRNDVPLVSTRLRGVGNIRTTDNHALIGPDFQSVLPHEATRVHSATRAPVVCGQSVLDVVQGLYDSPVRDKVFLHVQGFTQGYSRRLRGVLQWLRGYRSSEIRTNRAREAWVLQHYGNDFVLAEADCVQALKEICWTGKKSIINKLPMDASQLAFLKRLGLSATIRWRRGSSEAELPLTLKATEALACLCGIFVAEGSANDYQVGAAAIIAAKASLSEDSRSGFKEKTQIRQTAILACKEAGLPALQETPLQLRWQTKLMAAFFEYVVGVGKYAANKQVPMFVWNSNNSIREAFLYGYFLGDGHLDLGPRKAVVWTTVSRALAVGVHYLLLSLGLKGFVCEEKQVQATGNYVRYTVGTYSDCLGYSLNKTTGWKADSR